MPQDLSPSPTSIHLDLRPLLSSERHPAVFSAVERLRDGQAVELVNDHDPLLLYQHLQAREPGAFVWDYLDRGPLTWRVSIRRKAAQPATGGCCGACGGGAH